MATKRLRLPNYSMPYIVYHNGLWWLFRNRWKCAYHFKDPHAGVAHLCAATIPLLTEKLRQSQDYRLGFTLLKSGTATMRYFKFVYMRDPEYDIMGLRLKNRPHFNALDIGRTLAHDMLEHFPDDDGSPEHEFMALGASVYVRDGASYYHQVMPYSKLTVSEHIGSELIQQHFHMMSAGRRALRQCPRRRCIAEESYDEILMNAAHEGIRYLQAEFGDDDDQDISWATAQNILGWFRTGYARAARRYHNIPQWRMMDFFLKLSETCERVIKQCDYEGQEVHIGIQPSNRVIRVRFIEENY